MEIAEKAVPVSSTREYKLCWYHAHKAKAREYYAKNREAKIKKAVAWLKAKSQEDQQAYLRARYLKHKCKIASRTKKYQERNRARIQAYKVEYHKKNAAKLIASNREYLKREPPEVRARRLGRNSQYRKRNLAKYAAYARKRVALKAGATINVRSIDAWWTKIRASAAVPCYYCKTVMAGNLMHMDHVIPIKLGGSHSIGNCCAACPPCNLSKNATLPSEWLKYPQVFLSL